MNIRKSVELFKQAKAVLPGGVDSPVRAFRAVGGQPLFIERGEGLFKMVSGRPHVSLLERQCAQLAVDSRDGKAVVGQSSGCFELRARFFVAPAEH